MAVISLKDYAAQKNISYEAVRQQVNRYRDELNSHIIRDGRQQFLDEEAVAFLDAKREKHPVTILQHSKDETISELEHIKEQLLIKVADQADKIAELAEWKANNALAIAQSSQLQLLVETTRIDLEKAQKEVAEARQRIEELQNELNQEKQKTIWQRLFYK